MFEIFGRRVQSILQISIFALIAIGAETLVHAGALAQHVDDAETPAKSVAGAVQMAVCSGAHGGEVLNCKFGDGIEKVKRSVFSMAASGWRLISIVYDSERKVAYYYFSLE